MQKKWGIFMAALGFAALAQTAAAQTASGPQFLMTWRPVISYTPAGYIGKALPNQVSKITASLELISNGKPIDLSNQTIYWYLNDTLLGGSVGTQRVTFSPFGEAPNTLTLKVELPGYAGGLLIHEISIPLVSPLAVIEAPFPGGAFAASQATVQALPYFFNVTSTAPLNFSWTANGQAVASTENPQSLQMSIPQSTPNGYPVPVTLTISNPNDLTGATASANLTYQKQL